MDLDKEWPLLTAEGYWQAEEQKVERNLLSLPKECQNSNLSIY
jgi:hypothetical protein